MSDTERVTVSLPSEVRRTAQQVADETGTSFSAIVVSALEEWLRGRLIDSWLADFQERTGAFDEDELRHLALQTGVTYLPPGRDIQGTP